MAILTTAGIPVYPYGEGGRKVVLPVKATVQMREGQLVAQIAGACVPGTTSGAGDAVGVAEMDMLGGATDGATRISVLTDRTFLFANGAAPVLDSTPYGTPLYMEDDHTVGLGTLGANNGRAGYFVGIEDDGRVRLLIPAWGASDAARAEDSEVSGANITATGNAPRLGRVTRYLAAALGGATVTTLPTSGAVKGDIIRIIRTDTSAVTLSVVNGGAGAGTLCALVASKVGFAFAKFDGTNWIYDGSSAT